MSIEPCILAIDPGKSGAYAFLFPTNIGRGHVAVFDLPYAGKELDALALANAIAQFAPTLAIVEQQWLRPNEKGSNAFAIGRNYGVILGVIACSRLAREDVSPQKWKKHFGLLGLDKEASRARALAMYPAVADRFARKMDEGRAEAALLARYGADRFLRRDEAA